MVSSWEMGVWCGEELDQNHSSAISTELLSMF